MKLIPVIAIAVTLMMIGAAHANDAGVLACRASESDQMKAGNCGAHGCDCGLLRSECKATRKWLKDNAASKESMAYSRNKYAYDQDCK